MVPTCGGVIVSPKPKHRDFERIRQHSYALATRRVKAITLSWWQLEAKERGVARTFDN